MGPVKKGRTKTGPGAPVARKSAASKRGSARDGGHAGKAAGKDGVRPAQRAGRNGGRQGGRRASVETETVIMRVRELDPRAKCGAGTSVQRLFRVDAVSSGASVTHLVFLDRHGLYCEHGRACPAVSEVTKLDKSLKRSNQVG